MKVIQKNRDNFKVLISIIMALVMIVTEVGFLNFTKEAKAETDTITLYFIDKTTENWVKNDNAVIQLVDNTNGHTCYNMIKVDEITWSANVPKSAYNITFNRISPNNNIQWNSWSAGGRDLNNAYYASGAEYGYWGVVESDSEENYFHAGDIIYLDLTEFTLWEHDNALMYINFSEATKTQNNEKDIYISSINNLIYNPKLVDYKVEEHVYAYIVSKQDEGKDVLRFWRGNLQFLWNYSVSLSYKDYSSGIDSVKVTDWNETGEVYKSDYIFDINIDTDGDGLPDFDEIKLGTDRLNADTDGDGLSDYYELKYGYSPLNFDTDGNGISDGDEDFDGDGLKNIDEFVYKTDMANFDTDNDGLSDNDEISIYFTNPLKYDTDDDGISDGDEIKIGTNPLIKDTDGDGINDSNEIFTKEYLVSDYITYYDRNVYPTITVKGNADVLTSMDIDTRDWDALINCNVPGYIGYAYEFNCAGNFESAMVTFNIDEEIMKQKDFIPAIYYYNEKTQCLEKLENQTITGNTVSAELEHFSSYIVLNSREFDDVWNNDIMYYEDEELEKPLKIGFNVDCSSSMSSNDSGYLRNTVSNQIIDKMDEDDKGFVILFSNSVNIRQGLTNNKLLLKNAINSSYSSGMTALKQAVNSSINQFSLENYSETRNIIVILSDGYDTEGGLSVERLVEEANKRNIKIYTIGLGSNIDTNLLNSLADRTDGKYYYASSAYDLEEIYNKIGGETVDFKKDTNNDGISDYYTKLLCEGKLRTGTGIKIIDCILDANNDVLVGYTYEDVQANDDLDGDGLKNGEEIQIVSNSLGTYVIMKSDPTKKMSDMDMYSDYDEVKKYNTNALKDNIVISSGNLEILRDNDYYYSSLYSEAYKGISTKSISSWIGRKVYGTKYNDKNVCEKLLLDYFLYRNNVSKEDPFEGIVFYKDILCNINAAIKFINDNSEEYALAINEIQQLNNDFDKLQDFYFILREGSDMPQFDKELIAIAEKIDDIADSNKELAKHLDKNVICKFNLPDFINTTSLSRTLENVGMVFNFLTLSKTLSDGLSNYVTIQSNLNIMQSHLYILEAIANDKSNLAMSSAASELLSNLETKYQSYWYKAFSVLIEEMKEFIPEASKLVIIDAIVASQPLTIIDIIAVSFSDMLTGYSGTATHAYRVYQVGKLSDLIYSHFNSIDYNYLLEYNGSRSYYSNRVQAYDEYADLIYLRIFSENEMIGLQSSGAGWLNKLWDFIGWGAGSNRKKIIAECKEMIKELNGMLSKIE